MNMAEEAQKFAAIPMEVWAATIQVLTTELPMAKVESLVVALRQAHQVDAKITKSPGSEVV